MNNIILDGILKTKGQRKSKFKMEVDIMFGIRPIRNWEENTPKRMNWDFDQVFESMFDHINYISSYQPLKADVKEKDKEYILEIEIPGVEKEDINLEIKDDILTISVERKEEINEERENYIRRERKYGSFRRAFYVDDVDQEKIKAKFKHGVLKVKLPKKEISSPKENRISIE